MKYSKIYIRADANLEIATGHMMRCMSIAKEFSKRNIQVIFITADHYFDEILKKNKFKTICLNSKWNDLENEIPKLKSLIQQENIEKLIIDSYYVTKKYLKKLHMYAKLIYIDDLGKITYPVDILINYNIYGTKLKYNPNIYNSKTRLLLGTRYTPLREEFGNIEPVFRNKVGAIFLSTGGADKYNISGKLLKKIATHMKFKDIDFFVISGSLNKNLKLLKQYAFENQNIHICQNVTNMSEIMRRCDIAISASGSTMYELCVCGLPIITYTFADNQKQGAIEFAKADMAVNCGDIRNGEDKLLNNIVNQLENFINSITLRKRIFERQIELVDGEGVVRIVNEIEKL